MSSTRFAVAVHILAALAIHKTGPLTSEKLASSASTNPAVARRLLSLLARAGLTSSQLGKGGGAMLARRPKKITLRQVYDAVEEPGLVRLHRGAPDKTCLIGRNIQPVLRAVTNKAEAAFFQTLDTTSLKDIVREIRKDDAA